MSLEDMQVPDEHRDAAEEICSHLVSLRGGGLFLSSTDTLVLLGWLDEGTPVTSVLCALERAEERRRARRSRRPLTITFF